jgi:gluconolactonase
MHPARTLFPGVMLIAAICPPLRAQTTYPPHPDTQAIDGVPKGTVTQHTWTSRIFPGTTRDYWVYVPAQYEASKPACVMVFQDGANYVRPDGAWKAPTVFDNLIHRGEMPVTIGVFISPGIVPAAREGALPRFNRSFEYDAVGDRYVRFLLEEILAEVGKTHALRTDGNSRAIAGASSGAIAAFTAAWERPDAFARVVSTIGTYVGLRGGNQYPALIRRTEPKPIRVFLQDGSNDNNNYVGSWWVANQDMLSALQFAGYEVNHEWGDGAHDSKHGSAILPDMLRWIWKGYPAPIEAGKGSKQPIADVLIPGEEWQEVPGLEGVTSVASDVEGNVHVGTSGNAVVAESIQRETGFSTRVQQGLVTALAVGPDETVYVSRARSKEISRVAPGGTATVSSTIAAESLVVDSKGRLFLGEPSTQTVWVATPPGKPRPFKTSVRQIGGLALSPDQTLLFVTDVGGRFAHAFQIQPDGTLAYEQEYHDFQIDHGDTASGSRGIVADILGRTFTATTMGIQMCEPLGKVQGIILPPSGQTPTALTFGGEGLHTLYVVANGKLYKRLTKATGVVPAKPPLTPPVPRL